MPLSKQHWFKRIVLVSNRLPYKISSQNGHPRAHQSSGGLISAILALSESMQSTSALNQPKIQWIGCSEQQEAQLLRTGSLKIPFDLHPIVLTAQEYEGFYNGFANDYLWPLFHYFSSYAVFKEQFYDTYSTVNEKVAELIASLHRPGDFIWIHDYHFLLLPEFVRKFIPDAQIGFFLHIPFPSFEIFRLIPKPYRDQLIRGMVGADLVGFHTNDYMQHFLESVRKILGFEHDRGIIKTQERLIKADFFPISIDYEKFEKASISNESSEEIRKIQAQTATVKVIFSVDRLDYTKGIHDRLMGYDYFLQKNPEWQGKIVFIMVVVPSRDTIVQYQEMKKQIESAVGRINGAYCTLSWRPLIYQYKSLSFTELVSLYSLSDVALITPLRDGMNLVAKEYIACQTSEPGMLILSEMAGAAAELAEAIIINPINRQEVAGAIKSALEMPLAERETRIKRMQKRIRDYDVFTWALDFFNQFDTIRKAQEIFKVNIISPTTLKAIAIHYHKASSRLLFLDYDGTLVPYSKYPEQALPNDDVIKLLKTLCSDTRNTVVIVSGRDMSFLERWFGNLPIHIIAEHGASLKKPSEKWQSLLESNPDTEWKKTIYPIFDRYTDRCSGAYLEEKPFSFAWHYRNVDTQIAALRSHELKEELNRILVQFNDLQILTGNKVIEVKQSGYSKGSAAAFFLKDTDNTFIMAIGDDVTDEDLFRVMPQHAYTIKVGVEPSIAKYNLIRQSDVAKFFDKLYNQDWFSTVIETASRILKSSKNTLPSRPK